MHLRTAALPLPGLVSLRQKCNDDKQSAKGDNSARTALGLECAKKVITFCLNDRCRVAKQSDFP